MKKIILSVFMVLLCIFSFCSCSRFEMAITSTSCEHEWEDATCTKSQICKKCYKKEGEPLGHTTDAGRCERCGIVLGAWSISEYVDEFGTSTGEKYVFSSGEYGKFSNSATTNSKLEANVLVDCNSISIKLYEYGDQKVTGTFSKNPYRVGVLDESGNKYWFSGEMKQQGDRVSITDNKRQMMTLLKKRQTLKFYVENSEYTTSKYSFNIDTTGFSECYAECYPFFASAIKKEVVKEMQSLSFEVSLLIEEQNSDISVTKKELKTKQLELRKAETQRTIRVYNHETGHWEMSADPRVLAPIQEDIDRIQSVLDKLNEGLSQLQMTKGICSDVISLESCTLEEANAVVDSWAKKTANADPSIIEDMKNLFEEMFWQSSFLEEKIV